MYDVPVFSATLHPGQHTLVISAEGSNESLVLFDYILYTVDDEVRSQGTETPPLPRESTRASVGPSGPHSLSSSPTRFSTSAGIPRTPVTGAGNSEPSGAPGSVTSIIAGPTQSATPEPSVSNPNEEHPAKSPAFAGGIVGGIVGGVVAILVILFVTFILRRYAHLLRWPRKPAPISKDERVFKFDHHDNAGPSFPAEGGEPTTAPPLGSQHDTNSLSSLLPSSASRSPSPLASEDYTAVAPYSDPKFARRLTDVSKDSRPSSAPPGTEIGSRASSSLFPAEFTFVRASAAPPSHAVDVPAPALSVTSTARSVRYAELSRQIEALESAIQRLHYPGQPGSTPNPETQRVKRERLRALKGQIAELRTELAKEHRLAMEAAPKNKRKGKQPRQLAVVV
ncbi:hypothetical protein C8Q73DRAFT_803699 [Cubamyces lactineus]|nr:hypothetical protein C8Q73DRAFT_803699 [Cubamyces lactineus]